MRYFITAIDTDSGKTLVSAIVCQALAADYWKPVQAGLPRDADTIATLVSNGATVVHPETFLLKTPASPHAAAKIDGVHIAINDFRLPATDRALVIEGAGGCLVPLNDSDFMIDLIAYLNAAVIVVSDLYLGSINHTLLTMEALWKRNIDVKGIVFNGERNPESERIILHHSNLPCLLRIDREHSITKATVSMYAERLKKTWNG